VVKIDNLDTTAEFRYFNLAVIKTVNASTSVDLVGTYSITSPSKTITYTGEDVTTIKLNLGDISEKYPYYEIAQDLTAVQDVLIWDNLTSIDRINYQQIASQIHLQWQSYRLPADENYANEFNATNLKGYLRDEVYAFEIVFLLRNGKQTDGFHIPGRLPQPNDLSIVNNTNDDYIGSGTSAPYWKIYNTAYSLGQAQGTPIGNATPFEYGEFSYWESEETYPCTVDIWGDLINQPIRHHKFPDILVSPAFESATPQIVNGKYIVSPQNNAVYPLGVKVDSNQIKSLINSSSLTESQKEDIVGFKLIRGDRGTNKSIVAKGILRNVGTYKRQEQDYYYPNYPYNDLSVDPFIDSNNNAWIQESKPWIIWCYKLNPDGTEPTYNYTSAENGRITASFPMHLNEYREICSPTRPTSNYPDTMYVCPGNYDVIRVNSTNCSGFNIDWQDPSTNNNTTYIPKNDYLCGTGWFVAGLPGFKGCGREIRVDVGGGFNNNHQEGYFNPCPGTVESYHTKTTSSSITSPDWGPGGDFLNPTVGRRSLLDCSKETPIDSFNSSINKPYRQIFNSPETSFGQPFLGNVLKLENVMYGGGFGHHVEVKNNAKYRLITKEAQQVALKSSYEIASITSDFSLTAMFTTYQTYLQIYINGITRKNYAYSFNSTASYDYSADITNSGNKQRELDYKQYIVSAIQSVGEANPMNNYQRETSVYLKTKQTRNNNPVSALLYPNQTPSLQNGATPYIEDKSRYTISDANYCTTPERQKDITVVSYYASLKNIITNQWGQIYSYQTIDTGAQQIFDSATYKPEFTAFGGDTYISRFAFKTKVPFFTDNKVGAADDAEIFYDELGNIGYPKYWHSSRSILFDYVTGSGNFKNLISIKAHNFDCPSDPATIANSNADGIAGTYGTFYDGKFYLFAYGIPNFYCESSYNTDLRQAFNNKEGDFWPHVTTGIPDDWVQENFVSINFDNTYHYNPTFSKQNKENYFSHLPLDWQSKLCYTNYPFRAIYSDAQDQNADVRVNNWLSYSPTAFFDFPQNNGKLTSLDGIENKTILARFENKSLLYNVLLTMNSTNPKAAYLGGTKIFGDTPPVDFAETDLGFVGSQNKFLLKIPQGQITIDAKRGQVFLVRGTQIEDLSQMGSGMNRFFTDHLAFEILRWFPNVPIDNHFTGIGLHGVYDSKFDRVIITKLDYIPLDPNIKYDPSTNEFYIETTTYIPGPQTPTTTTTSSTTQSPSQCCTTVHNIPLPTNSFTVNGISINVTSTDANKLVILHPGSNVTPACLPSYRPNTLYMGKNATGDVQADFTLNFAVPVNNVKLRLVNYSVYYEQDASVFPRTPYPHLEYQELFTFTTNGIACNIINCDACQSVISGNTLTCLLDLPNGLSTNNGSGVITLSSDNPFTTLKIKGEVLGVNTDNNSLSTWFELCDFTIA